MVYPYLELHILFYSNGLAIWSSFPDIKYIKKIMADQGLTQTFLSSGSQDHQLRESGGPTFFLVVLRIKSRHTNSYAYITKKWVS